MTKTDITAAGTQADRPEFIRLPKPGTVCKWTGLGRSFIYQLANEGHIKTVSLRQRGKVRGVRLIFFDSLIEYIRKTAREQTGGVA